MNCNDSTNLRPDLQDALDQEQPIFINPAGPDDPEKLITFTDLGRARATGGDQRGKETIQELGLNRDPLQERRQERLQYLRSQLTIKRLAALLQDEDSLTHAEQELERCIRADAEYAGLARSFLR